MLLFFFFFNDTATTEIYTLSLHDALPILGFVDPTDFKDQFGVEGKVVLLTFGLLSPNKGIEYVLNALPRSEEHTSELQSRLHLVCRLLLEKKKKKIVKPSMLLPATARVYY